MLENNFQVAGLSPIWVGLPWVLCEGPTLVLILFFISFGSFCP